jgi:hypothetical protein
VRDAAGEFDHLQAALDIALGIRNGLAVFARQAVRELVIIALGQFEELHHHARAALRIGVGPLHLRRLGVLHGGANLGLGGQRHLGLDVTCHRLENVGRPSRCTLDLFATNEMSDCAHVFLQN